MSSLAEKSQNTFSLKSLKVDLSKTREKKQITPKVIELRLAMDRLVQIDNAKYSVEWLYAKLDAPAQQNTPGEVETTECPYEDRVAERNICH